MIKGQSLTSSASMEKLMDSISPAYYPGCISTKVDENQFKVNCPEISSTPVISILFIENWISFNITVICESSVIDVRLPKLLKTLDNFVDDIDATEEFFQFEIKNCKLSNESDNTVWQKVEPEDKISLTLENVSNINRNAFVNVPIKKIVIINTNLKKRLNCFNVITNLTSLHLYNNDLSSLDGLYVGDLQTLTSFQNKIKKISRKTFVNVTKLEYIRHSS